MIRIINIIGSHHCDLYNFYLCISQEFIFKKSIMANIENALLSMYIPRVGGTVELNITCLIRWNEDERNLGLNYDVALIVWGDDRFKDDRLHTFHRTITANGEEFQDIRMVETVAASVLNEDAGKDEIFVELKFTPFNLRQFSGKTNVQKYRF
jgi:hypothetical protein